jgi:hypothetical protein
VIARPSQANFLTSTVPIAQQSAAPSINNAPMGAAPSAPKSLTISSTRAVMPRRSAAIWRALGRA